jgi:hypothetical protein
MVMLCVALMLLLIPPALAQEDAPTPTPDAVIVDEVVGENADAVLPIPQESGVFISHEALNAVVVIVGGFMTLIGLLVIALYNSSPPSAQRFFTPVLDVFKDLFITLKDKIPGAIDDAVLNRLIQGIDTLQTQLGKKDVPETPAS